MLLVCVWYRGCVIATLFWLLTVSFPWWCMLAVFLFLCFRTLWCTWPEQSSVCTVAVSRLLSFHLPFAFLCPPPFVFFYTKYSDSSPPLSLHVSIAVILSILIILSRMFFHFVCYQDTQPAVVWMHNIKALHFNEQLFKASFGGMLWLCMYRSFNIRVFLV